MKTKSLLMLAVLALLATVGFTSCDELAVEDNPMQSYLTMRTSDVALTEGETYVRKAVAAGTAVVVYSSSDATVATVDQTGTVTANAAGTAVITAQTTGYNAEGKKIYLAEEKSYKVTVKPATLPAATITTAPVATAGDILAGSATALVTAGVADGGTMMYEVTTSNTKPATTDGFSATVPTAATRAAGTYYVWYYAKADAQHADSEIAATAIEVTVTEVYAANEYKEASWDGTKVVFTRKTAASGPTAVADASTDVTWSAGWYTVSGNVTITGDVTLGAETHLILQDGAKLTINGLISGSSKNLYIYGQANQTGQLVVNCTGNDAILNITTLEVHSCKVKATSSWSWCGGFFDIGLFNVYGGSVDAEYTGSDAGYGISLKHNGSMNIYGGDVKAVGKGNVSSFSCGISSTSSIVTVYGGKLWAECATKDALYGVTLAKDAGFTGKIETSDNGTSWTVHTAATTPNTKYVRVGY